MQVMENGKFFSEISNEECAVIKGGDLNSAAAYTTVAGAFGIKSPQTTLLFLMDALPTSGGTGSVTAETTTTTFP